MRTVVTSQWAPVDLGDVEIRGVEWGYDRALAYGYHRPADDLIPFVAHVRDDGVVTVYDMPATGRINSLHQAGSQHAVALGESPTEVLFVDEGVTYPEITESDESFRFADRTWLAGCDEHIFYVAEWEDGRLTTGEAWHEDFPEGPGLRLHGGPQDLLVCASDVRPFVAGLLSSADGPPSPGLWTSSEDMGPRYPGGWERVELDPAPDAFTHLVNSSQPTFVGHRDGRPLLFSFHYADHPTGRSLDVPDVLLDPHHPQVLQPWTSQVALQSRDEGPQLWVRDDVGWVPRPLPPGRLDDAAVCTTSDLVWVVVDGTMWRPTG
jgi:hypothetical protein